MNRYQLFFAWLMFLMALLVVAPGAWASGDVFLAESGGQVAIGSGNDVGPVDADLSVRVFEGVMIAGFPPFNPADYGRDEPGFFSLPVGNPELPLGASALPGNALVTINLAPFAVNGVSDSLFYWDGVGGVNFLPAALAQPGVQFSIAPNPVGSSGASGGLDLHPITALEEGGVGVPSDGVYLVAPTVSVAGLADSDRFFQVWLVDALVTDEQVAEDLEASLEVGEIMFLGKDFTFFEQAVAYVGEQLVVPEPTSTLLAAVAVVGMLGVSALRWRG